jgi:hypothetical protein
LADAVLAAYAKSERERGYLEIGADDAGMMRSADRVVSPGLCDYSGCPNRQTQLASHGRRLSEYDHS